MSFLIRTSVFCFLLLLLAPASVFAQTAVPPQDVPPAEVPTLPADLVSRLDQLQAADSAMLDDLAGLSELEKEQLLQISTSLPGEDMVTEGVVTLATVNVQNTKIIAREENSFTLGFDVANRTGEQPGINYGVELVAFDGPNKGFVAHVQRYAEVLEVGSNESLSKTIVYEAPDVLSGSFEIYIRAATESGLPLALAKVGTVTLAGTAPAIALHPARCVLQVPTEDTVFGLHQGVDIALAETLELECQLPGAVSKELEATIALYERTWLGNAVLFNSKEQTKVLLTPGTEDRYAVRVPKPSKPQAYEAVLALTDTQTGEVVSQSMTFHFVVQGSSATILNAVLDKNRYDAGDTAEIVVHWSPSADLFGGSRIGTGSEYKNAIVTVSLVSRATNNSCLEPFSESVVVSPLNTSRLLAEITTDCRDPELTVSVSDGVSTLATQSFGLQSDVEVSEAAGATEDQMAFWITVITAIGALLVLVLVALFVRKKKEHIVMLLLLVGVGFFSTVSEVRADTLMIPFIGGDHQVVVVNLDKSVYAPGEQMTITGAVTSLYCNNISSGLYTNLKANINGNIPQTSSVLASACPAGYPHRFLESWGLWTPYPAAKKLEDYPIGIFSNQRTITTNTTYCTRTPFMVQGYWATNRTFPLGTQTIANSKPSGVANATAPLNPGSHDLNVIGTVAAWYSVWGFGWWHSGHAQISIPFEVVSASPSNTLEVCSANSQVALGNSTVPLTSTDGVTDTYQVYYDDVPDCAGTNIAGTVSVSEVANPDADAVTIAQAANLTVTATNPDPGDRRENVVITHGGQTVTLQYAVPGTVSPPPTVSLTPDADPIDEGDDVTLTWTTTNVRDCSAPWTSSTAANGSETLTNVTTSQTYTITCTGDDDSTIPASTDVTVNPLPNLTADVGALISSATFDPTTGYYDELTVTYNVRNPGGGSAGASVLRFRVDVGNDGSFNDTFTINIGALAAHGGETGTILRPVATNVPPGQHRVVLDVDHGDAVRESNEGDNSFTRESALLTYPDPGISLTVDPVLVRTGEDTTLSWNTNATYDLSCDLIGPGISSAHTFNPLTDGAADSLPGVGPITAKSEYRLECTAPDGTTFTDTATVETTGTIEEV